MFGCPNCTYCTKREYNLERHIKAKHTEQRDPLTCHLCNKSFKSKQGLNGHILKFHTASTDANTVYNSHSHNITTTTNSYNTTTTNNITNHNTITNGATNIICVTKEGIEFLDDHITKSDLRRMMTDSHHQASPFLIAYAEALLARPENRCVRKRHITSTVCEAHIGDGIWEYKPDRIAIQHTCHGVAISANDKLYTHKDVGYQGVRNEINEQASYFDVLRKNKDLWQSIRLELCNMSKTI